MDPRSAAKKRTLVIIVPSTKGMMDTKCIIGRKHGLQWTRNATARLATSIMISLASLSKSSIVSFEQIVKLVSLIRSDVWLMQGQVESTSLGLLNMVNDPRSSPKLLETNKAICIWNLESDRIFNPMGLKLMQGQRLYGLKRLVA